jgi:DNA-binding MarR family transcriptional regulator
MPVIEAQVSILRRLHEMGPMTPAALADELRFARSTISKLSQGLLEDEIIERRPSDIDGRSFFLAPTTKGHDILETFRHDREQVLSIALRQLSPADIKRISRAMPSLEKLETVLNRDADEAEANRP